MLQFIVNNSNSIQALLSKKRKQRVSEKISPQYIEQARQFVKTASIKQSDEEMAEYSSVFGAGGMPAPVQEWFHNGMDKPTPELAKMLTRLIRDTLRQGGRQAKILPMPLATPPL
jgi:hypothetical protein